MKKRKEKITYIDDGRTIADMSNVSGGFSHRSRPSWQPSPRFKDVWNTYWNAVKMMFTPMLVVICAIAILYMILYFLFLIM